MYTRVYQQIRHLSNFLVKVISHKMAGHTNKTTTNSTHLLQAKLTQRATEPNQDLEVED